MVRKPRELLPEGLTVVTIHAWEYFNSPRGRVTRVHLSNGSTIYMRKQIVTNNNVVKLTPNFINLCKQVMMYKGGGIDILSYMDLEEALNYLVENKTHFIVQCEHKEFEENLFLDVKFVDPSILLTKKEDKTHG